MLTFTHVRRVSQTRDFSYLNWTQLTEIIASPPTIQAKTAKEAKSLSPAIGATDARTKRKTDIEAHNRFTLLRIDLDDTDLELEAIADTLEGMELESFAIHTTPTHRQENNGNRYRVYIELEEPLDLATWQSIETYLSYVFMADDCATRPQQLMFLPCLFNGCQYNYHINHGKPFIARNSRLLADSMAFKTAQDARLHKATSSAPARTRNKPPIKLVGNQVSIIDAVNQSYNWNSLLPYYGYKKQGRAWLPPEATSKIAGAYILSGDDGKERYYSHHQSDPCATGHCLDLFDFITIRSFSGNARAAIKQLAETSFKHITQHNRKEYMKHKSCLVSKGATA